jgi:hypothetical protein
MKENQYKEDIVMSKISEVKLDDDELLLDSIGGDKRYTVSRCSAALGDGRLMSFNNVGGNDGCYHGILSTYDQFGSEIDNSERYFNAEVLPVIESFYTEEGAHLDGLKDCGEHSTLDIVESVNGSKYAILLITMYGRSNDGHYDDMFAIKIKILEDYTQEFISVSRLTHNGDRISGKFNMPYRSRTKAYKQYVILNTAKIEDSTFNQLIYNTDTNTLMTISDIFGQEELDKRSVAMQVIIDEYSEDNEIEIDCYNSLLYDPTIITCNGEIKVHYTVKLTPKDESEVFYIPVFEVVDLDNITLNIVPYIEKIFYDSYIDTLDNNDMLQINSSYCIRNSWSSLGTIESSDILNTETIEEHALDNTALLESIFPSVHDHLLLLIEKIWLNGTDLDGYIPTQRHIMFAAPFVQNNFSAYGDVATICIVLLYVDPKHEISEWMYIQCAIKLPEFSVMHVDNVYQWDWAHYVTMAKSNIDNSNIYFNENNYTPRRSSAATFLEDKTEISIYRYRYTGDDLIDKDTILKNVKAANVEPDNVQLGNVKYNVDIDGLYESNNSQDTSIHIG